MRKEFYMEFPNIPTPTLGGHIFWSNELEKKGWRLQHNKITGLYRILDPSDIRRTWGPNYEELKHSFEVYTSD